MKLRSLRKYRFLPFLLVVCFITACSLTILSAPRAYADGTTIDDQANVLDVSRVQAEAAKLPNPLLIYTTNTFSGDQSALDQATRNRLPDQNSIAMGIDVAQRHLSIQSGTSVKLSDSQASDAVNAFRSNFNGGDYTGATVATIDSLLSALSPGAANSPNTGTATVDNSTPIDNSSSSVDNSTIYTQTDPGTSDNGGTTTGVVIAIVVVVVLLLLIIVAVRKGLKDGNEPPDDNDWRGPRGGGDDFSRGVIYGSLLAEGQEHHHHPEHFGNGFGGSNFGGGFGGSNFGGGAGGSFGGGNVGGGAGGSFGGGNTGGGAGGSF